jgi:hypothetical protein
MNIAGPQSSISWRSELTGRRGAVRHVSAMLHPRARRHYLGAGGATLIITRRERQEILDEVGGMVEEGK